MLDACTFRFLGVTGSVRTASDWDGPARSQLWRYHLHYFDDLNAVGASARRAWHLPLIDRWIRENPPATGTGWDSYPVSLRLVNWIKWAFAAGAHGAPVLTPAAVASVAMQARWLRRRMEIHLLGNHLWANAKALVFAGAYFDGSEARAWRDHGATVLRRELVEQVLADGGHFERSPMYHAILLEDVLELIELAQVVPGAVPADLLRPLRDAAPRMMRWLRVMTHPDGQVAFFNDAAFGIAAGYATLREYARQLEVPVDDEPFASVEVLPQSGYVRLQTERAVLLCDVAPIGPDYLPAHAHADTLSFELSLDGQRVVVNGGTSTYDMGSERNRQRSTAAHNTVEVDGADSSETWASFRVGGRARPLDVSWGRDGGAVWVAGAHDGYRRLPGRVIHRRRWTLDAEGMAIDDRLDGQFRTAVARLHLHPRVDADIMVERGSHAAICVGAQVIAHAEWTTPGALSVAPSTWHPTFGEAVPATVLSFAFTEPTVAVRLRWG